MSQAGPNIKHFGTVKFVAGKYVKTAGSDGWCVEPIAAFDPPKRVPVGQIEIYFDEPINEPYTIMVSCMRTEQSPLMAANYGDVTAHGFVVHLWEIIADRTLQNGHFSFMVLL